MSIGGKMEVKRLDGGGGRERFPMSDVNFNK